MTCDVTKVTYNMYTCYKCCMNREMMEMDDLDSAKWQKSRIRDKIGIIWKFKGKRQIMNSVVFLD